MWLLGAIVWFVLGLLVLDYYIIIGKVADGFYPWLLLMLVGMIWCVNGFCFKEDKVE